MLNEIIDSAIKKSISVEEEVKAKIKDLFKIDNKKIPSSTYQIKNFSLMLTPPQMKFMFSPQINNTYNQNIFIINPVSPFNQQSQTLYSKLSKDLFTLTTKTEMNNFFLFKIKQSVLQIVKEIAVKSFSSAPFTQYKISYDLYGSFATGLNIEKSDIDFMVKFMNKEDITLQLLTQLNEKNNSGLIHFCLSKTTSFTSLGNVSLMRSTLNKYITPDAKPFILVPKIFRPLFLIQQS